MQLNSRRRRDQQVGAHPPHDVILVTLDNPNRNTRTANLIADACRYQASSIATRMLMNTDSARTSHTAATRMLRDGVPIEVVSKILGHGSVVTTSAIYGHLTAADARAALEKAGWLAGRKVTW